MPMTGKQKSCESHRGPIGVCRRTNVGGTQNHLCHWGYADENFDLSGTFDYTFFDSKEEAYQWLRIDKNVVSQIHNVHILSKWTNLFGADDWEQYFPTIVIINSPCGCCFPSQNDLRYSALLSNIVMW